MPVAIVVCPVVPYPPVSGGQKRTLRLLEAMERAGLEPHIVTADGDASVAVETLRARGWTVDVVPAPAPSVRARARQHVMRRPSPFLPGVAARVRELAGRRAALLQLEHTLSAYYGAPVPTLLSLHNLDSRLAASARRGRRAGSLAWLRETNRAQALRALERSAFPRVARVVCVSHQDAAAVALAGGRPLLAPNGVDDDFFDVPTALPSAPRALFFGHFGYEPNRRGLERFVAAGWPMTRGQLPDARLIVAGGGLDARLRARLEAQPGVKVAGLVGDLREALARARAVVVPIWEGGGTRLKVLEALAAARPVAGTPLGLSGLGLVDGRHAVVAEAPAALGAALASLLGGANARSEVLAAEGRRLADAFRWPRALADLEALYARLAGT